MIQQMQAVNCVLNRDLNFALRQAASERDYKSVVTPRTFTGRPLVSGNGVSQAQADAATAMSDAVAELSSLELAVLETYNRLQSASEAQDWHSALLQTQAYQDFQQQRADALDTLANTAEALADANEAAGLNALFTPQDYAAYLAELQASGYDANSRTFFLGTGLSEDEIALMLQAEREAFEEALPTASVYFNTPLRDMASESRATAQALRAFFPTSQTVKAAAQEDARQQVAGYQIPFALGNPTEISRTVTLVIRPVDMPLQWQASLSQAAVKLGAGQQTEVALMLDPGDQPVLKDVDVQVAVEGYLDGELIGGVLVRQWVPGEVGYKVYLPVIQRW